MTLEMYLLLNHYSILRLNILLYKNFNQIRYLDIPQKKYKRKDLNDHQKLA